MLGPGQAVSPKKKVSTVCMCRVVRVFPKSCRFDFPQTSFVQDIYFYKHITIASLNILFGLEIKSKHFETFSLVLFSPLK